MNRTIQIGRKSERGQGFMELAVSLVFLLILFSAVVDLGWAFYTMTALRDVAQEGASYGAMCNNLTKVKDHLRKSASEPIDMSLIPDADLGICYMASGSTSCMANPASAVRGDMVRISLTYQHKIVTPFVGAFIGTQSYPLKVDVTDTVLAPTVCP